MWKKIYDIIEQVLTLTQRVTRHDKQIDELSHQMRELTLFVHRNAGRQEAERETMRLWIENQILKIERKQLKARLGEETDDEQ